MNLRELTMARVALGRAGHSLPTRELLAFQLAHAKARDAVWRALDPRGFEAFQPIYLHSAAPDRATYLRRPDLGRKLDSQSVALLTRGDWDLMIVVADGLSAAAIDRHAAVVLTALLPMISDWRVAPV